jgi:NAD-dependent dihydropyrimidine dehydrogenase PreA subunit
MAYVIAEPCVGVKDASCVDACPVDCIHPKKSITYEDGRPGFDEVPQLYIDPVECIDCEGLRSGLPSVSHLFTKRSTREVEALR